MTKSMYDMYPASLRTGQSPETAQTATDVGATEQLTATDRTLFTERGAAGLGHDYETDFDTTKGNNELALQQARQAVQMSFRA